MLQITILRLEPASQPQNLRAEPQKFERATARSSPNRMSSMTFKHTHCCQRGQQFTFTGQHWSRYSFFV